MSDVEAYQNVLGELLPKGPAFDHWQTEGSRLGSLLTGLAGELARLDDAAKMLIRESNPRTAVQTLAARYAEAGLPNACQERATRISQMRAEVLFNWTARGGSSVNYFLGVIQRSGIPARITEFQPFQVERSTVQSPLYGDTYAHCWGLTLVNASEHDFAVGEDRAGDPLKSWEDGPLLCLLQQLKPAHTVIVTNLVDSEAELTAEHFW